MSKGLKEILKEQASKIINSSLMTEDELRNGLLESTYKKILALVPKKNKEPYYEAGKAITYPIRKPDKIAKLINTGRNQAIDDTHKNMEGEE